MAFFAVFFHLIFLSNLIKFQNNILTILYIKNNAFIRIYTYRDMYAWIFVLFCIVTLTLRRTKYQFMYSCIV